MQTSVLNSSAMSDWKSKIERIKIAESLHQAIRSGDISGIERLPIEEHDSMNGFILNGKSPLTVALEVKKLGIFSYLLSSGLPLDENCRKMLGQLSESEKNEIGNNNLLSAKSLSKANLYFILSILKASSRLNRIDEKKSSAIEKLFMSLDNIESIQPLMKAVRHIGQLEITFDFNNDNIQCLWPSSVEEGLTLVQRKKILFAARGSYNENSDFVFDGASAARGTIIHEITHFVMENFYDSGKPYYWQNQVRKRMFKEITDEMRDHCQRDVFEDPLFKEIFDLYDEGNWESELIARAAEVTVKYFEDKTMLEFMRERARNLFQFFDETLKNFDSFEKSEWSIRELNRSFKVHVKLVNSKISFKKSMKNLEIPNDTQVISSNAPLFCMAHILNEFQSSLRFEVDSRVIFAEFETLEKKVWDVVNAFHSSDKTVLVVDCENISNEKIIEALSFLKQVHMCRRIIFVTDSKLVDELQNQSKNVKCENRNYKWDDLEYLTQERILDRSVEFQNGNKKIILFDILTTTSEACKFLPLQETFTNNLKIDKSLTSTHESFYLPRSFEIGQKQNKNDETVWEDIEYDELYRRKNLGKMLISDIAGTGKTVIIERLAKSLKDFYPNFWVNLIDLKNFTNELKQVEKSCTSLSFLNLFEKVFKKGITDLEREVLKELYNEGRVIVLFDSFDEISPNFKEIAKVIIEKFELRDGNQLWVATRPHLENELKSDFGFTVVRLKELTRESQVDFLMQSWVQTDTKSEKKANELIDRLQNLIRSKSGYVGYPMLMKMIADICSEDFLENEEDFGYFFIYDNFFKKHISKWGSVSEVAKRELEELECSGAQRCPEVHQILAIKSIFGSDFAEADFNIDDKWTDEKIMRVRIVKNIKTYQFIHETFAEYFVSVFIKNSLTRSRNNDFDKVVQIIKIVILKGGHRIIRSFLNANLRVTKVSSKAREKINAMVRGLNSAKLEMFLNYIVKENLNVVFDLFEFHTFDSKITIRLLRGLSLDGWGNFVQFSFSINSGLFLRSLIRCLKVLNKKDQKSLVTYEGKNIFHRLLENPHGLDPAALEYIESVFSREEIVTMLLARCDFGCVLEKAFRLETSENSFFVKNSCNLLKKYLSLDQIKSVLFRDQANCLAHAAGFHNEYAINSIFEFAEQVFGRNSDELRNILKSNYDGETFLTINLECNEHDCSYEALRSNLSRNGFSEDEMNKLLTDAPHEVIVECLDNSYRKEKTFSTALSLFPPEKQLRLIDDCMQLSSGSSQLDFFVNKYSELWDELGSRISKDEIKKLMMDFDFCIYAVTSCDINVYKSCMENHFLNLEKNLDEDEIIELLLRNVDRDGRNVITKIACKLEPEQVESFFEVLQKFDSDLSRKLFLSSDSSGNNIFHAAAQSRSKEGNFSTVMCLMRKRFDDEKIKNLILASNNKNESVFHFILKQFCDVEEQLTKVLDREEIKNLIMDEENYELELVRCLGTTSCKTSESDETFAENFSVLKKYFTNEEIFEFLLKGIKRGVTQWELLLAIYGRGRNVFHNPASERDLIEFATVFRLMNERFDNENVRKLLLSVDENNHSILFCVLDNFHEMVELISAVLSKDDIKNLISHEFVNIMKRNLADILKPKSEQIFNKITCLEKYLTHGELVGLMQKENEDGHNIIYLLCFCDNERNISNFFEMMKKFGHQLSWKLFSAVDRSGENIFHYSARSEFPGAFPIVLRLMKESFGNDEVRKLLLIRNIYGVSILLCFVQTIHRYRSLDQRQKEFYVNKYLEIISNEISIGELKNMLFSKTKSGDSWIQIMRELNYRSTFENLRELGIDVDNEELKASLHANLRSNRCSIM